jgi:hypothetical protein
LFVIFLSANRIAFCSEDSTAAIIPADSAPVDVRTPSPARQKSIFSRKEFLYDKQGPPPKPIGESFSEWLSRYLDKIFNSEEMGLFWKIFQWVLIAATVVIVAVLLTRSYAGSLFFGTGKSRMDFSEVTEDIHAIDFDKLISEALESKNYRRVVRLYFLKMLKCLTDKDLIRWKPDKTNSDYHTELKGSDFQPEFRSASMLYEYIWYGDFKLNEEEFRFAIERMKQLNEHLNN